MTEVQFWLLCMTIWFAGERSAANTLFGVLCAVIAAVLKLGEMA
jgi:hypothetical protein